MYVDVRKFNMNVICTRKTNDEMHERQDVVKQRIKVITMNIFQNFLEWEEALLPQMRNYSKFG